MASPNAAAALTVSSWLEPAPWPKGGGDAPTPPFIYSVRFANVSSELLDGVRITSPIPAAFRYVGGSASGPAEDVLFSVDGGDSFGAPGELTVAAADGARRTAEPADYTHVRWIVAGVLDVGAAGFARFAVVPR